MLAVTSSMRRITLAIAFLLAPGLLHVPAQQRRFLLNRDIITLAKAGFTEQAIIDTIRATPNRFDVTTGALVALAAQGISQRVVEALLVAQTRGSPSDLAGAPRCDPKPLTPGVRK